LNAGDWDSANPAVKDVVPAITRGNNLVVVVPPAPVYATPALAALIDRRVETGLDVLVVVPSAGLREWSRLLAGIAGDVSPAPLVALGLRQAERRLPQGAGVLVATAPTSLALRERSLIVPDRVGAVLVAWPELWEDTEALTVLLQDFPREVQRVVLTTNPTAVAPLVERHAWRAMTTGVPLPFPEPAGSVRTVSLPWDRRIEALSLLAERLNADSLGVWAADTSRQQEIRQALAGSGAEVRLWTTAIETASQVIAFDPPTPETLARLLEAAPVTVLVPPGAERWIERIAAERKPLVLSAALDASDAELARRRRVIEQAIQEEPLDEGFAALGPVFEQHDPATVASALYHLWTRIPRTALARQTEQATAAAPRSRIWIGAGKRDEVGVSDLVGFLIKEVRLDRATIGRIELRDTFALVEVPAPEAERIAQNISGKTLRKRRLVAKVDRKP
jgi:ATP-dependent RNA helicase DeaD